MAHGRDHGHLKDVLRDRLAEAFARGVPLDGPPGDRQKAGYPVHGDVEESGEAFEGVPGKPPAPELHEAQFTVEARTDGLDAAEYLFYYRKLQADLLSLVS